MQSHANESAVFALDTDMTNSFTWPQQIAEQLKKLADIQQGSQRLRRPVGIIGPGDGDEVVCAAARQVAYALAGSGIAIVCGGRGGVMAAASRGAREGGGVVIGILPEEDERNANEWLSVALPTGMGEMRNALISRSASCLVAIGGNMGTLSEMALGLKWGTPVFVLHGDVVLPGAVQTVDVNDMVAKVTDCLIKLAS